MRDKAIDIFSKEGFGKKVRRILRLKLVHRDGNGGFVCNPLPGNHETRHIKSEKGLLVCDCDGYHVKAKHSPTPSCSHCEAVRQMFPEVNQGVLFAKGE
jgi:hypothetical protein